MKRIFSLPGPIVNLQYWAYWTSTEYAFHPNSVVVFSFSQGGYQHNAYKDYYDYAMVVRDGNVVPVPERRSWSCSVYR
jgi:hypothetical protein